MHLWSIKTKLSFSPTGRVDFGSDILKNSLFCKKVGDKPMSFYQKLLKMYRMVFKGNVPPIARFITLTDLTIP